MPPKLQYTEEEALEEERRIKALKQINGEKFINRMQQYEQQFGSDAPPLISEADFMALQNRMIESGTVPRRRGLAEYKAAQEAKRLAAEEEARKRRPIRTNPFKPLKELSKLAKRRKANKKAHAHYKKVYEKHQEKKAKKQAITACSMAGKQLASCKKKK